MLRRPLGRLDQSSRRKIMKNKLYTMMLGAVLLLLAGWIFLIQHSIRKYNTRKK
jgi:hypothetical protein